VTEFSRYNGVKINTNIGGNDTVLTGDIRNKIDRIWDTFWSGGISNPLEVIEQMTYLLFIKRLDEIHTRKEKQANRFGEPIENPIFTTDQENLRWSRLSNMNPSTMYETLVDEIFPFIKELNGENTAFAQHIKGARFTLPPEKAGLLAKVVDMLNEIPMEDRDTKGDLYEYMLSKLSEAGQNGQFRTPRHIIRMMVDLVDPKPADTICDPACGTAGFLLGAANYLKEHYHQEIFTDETNRRRFKGPMFHGFDFDTTMLRIASMNMLLHGIEDPVIQNRDSLSQNHGDAESMYSLVLANPPFAGSLDYDSIAKDLLQVVKTKKTELLFLALFLRLLEPGGRAAVIVPDGVLFGSSRAHKKLRKMLVEDHKLQAVISMPSGVFKPYSGVSTAVLVFTRTDSGGTDQVWFYDMQADGYSLDDKRSPLELEKHEKNNLPDIIQRFHNLGEEKNRERTEQSFLVPKEEIAENDYDLSINRYKEIVYELVDYDSPIKILTELDNMEKEIQERLKHLRGLLK
jgi:type I restriction enzyme M protein